MNMATEFNVVGKGGREHALATILARMHKVYSFGGSDAIRQVAEPLDSDVLVNLENPLSDEARDALLSKPDAIIVFGPEQPMAAGWVDQIRLAAPAAQILGPNQYAAQLESSKWWAKDFMMRNAVPTGAAERIKKVEDFDRFALRFEPPYVIKADGLAAGKGVAILPDAAPARDFVEGIVSGDLFGTPQTALIEEYLEGPELSIFLLLDGTRAVQIGMARDYKRAYDGDEGPNTGGMGAFTPVPDISAEDQEAIDHTVLRPILHGLKSDGIFYRGFLYVGLMRTTRGFKVLEFNVRMGDPEAQAVLPVLGDRLPLLLEHAAAGRLVDLSSEPWMEESAFDDLSRVRADRAAVCVVLASQGYPEPSPSGLPLAGLDGISADMPRDTFLFHAGTKRVPNGWETNGGRVLNAVAIDDTVATARTHCYAAMERMNCSMLRYRTDIARRE